MSGRYTLHQYMLDTFVEADSRGEVGWINDPVAATVKHDAVLAEGILGISSVMQHKEGTGKTMCGSDRAEKAS